MNGEGGRVGRFKGGKTQLRRGSPSVPLYQAPHAYTHTYTHIPGLHTEAGALESPLPHPTPCKKSEFLVIIINGNSAKFFY